MKLVMRQLLALAIAFVTATAQGQNIGANPAAAPAFVPSVSLFRASPPVIQPIGGKLPNTMNVAVIENCASPNAVDLSHDKLIVTGAGLTLSTQNPSKCLIQATLDINPNTPAGTYSLMVVDSNGSPVDSADISVLDSTAGAIPPGLAPEVDVLWNVMSQNNCSDVFGKRVAQSFYCVQLKIGNNSGHPLQVAGVGFAKSIKALAELGIPQFTIANTSYGSTRAVLVASQVWSTRNIVYNTISGAGLIMAASTPFFFGSAPSQLNAKTRFLTLTTIAAGPLLQAFNLVAPDPIVSQLKSLDDQSFRDNMVIPNNSQIQTVVFVAKQDLTLALREVQIELSETATQARNQASAQSSDKKNAESKAQALEAINSSTGETLTNSTRPKWRKGQPDPSLIKVALGSVLIVGDEIAYLQRVQIQNSGNANSTVVVSISPTAPQIPIGTTQAFTANVVNDPNGSGVTWTISGPSCSGAGCGALSSATATTVTYTAPSAVPAPNNTVTITATSKADSTKSATVNIVITPAPISVTVSPKPGAATHAGSAVPFTAAVSNDPSAAGVNWTLSGAGCAGPNCGTLTPTTNTAVNYTPPAISPNPNTITLTATSRADASKSDPVVITIN